MIQELRLRNFRAFENARFVFADGLTVLVGSNGSGKTTIVDALEFIREYLRRGQESQLLDTIGRRVPGMEIPPDLSLAAVLKISRRTVLYGFTLGFDLAKNRFVVKEELLRTSTGRKGFQRVGNLFIPDASPAQLSSLRPEPEEGTLILPLIASLDPTWREVLSVLRNIRQYNIVPQAVAGEQEIPISNYLLRSGSNAGEVLRRLQPDYYSERIAILDNRIDSLKQERLQLMINGMGRIATEAKTDDRKARELLNEIARLSGERQAVEDIMKIEEAARERRLSDVAWIVEHLAQVTPGIKNIYTAITGTSSARRRVINFVQEAVNGDNRFNASEMSDGTLRSFGILLALRQKPAPSLVFIDEIEDSLHPDAIYALLGAIQDSTSQLQVAVTSHSPLVLSDRSTVSPQNVRVVHWEQGISSVFNIHPRTISLLRRHDSLGDLFSAGAIRIEDEPATVDDELFFELTVKAAGRENGRSEEVEALTSAA